MKKRHSNIYWRIFSDYSKKDKIWSSILIVVLLFSLFRVIFPGADIVEETNAQGIYTEGVIGTVRALNPVYADLNEAERDISRLIFSGLVKYDPKTRTFVSDLADLELSNDKLTYTFILKQGVKWHDGQQLTAEDVYFTYHDVIQSQDFANLVLKSNFDGVEVKQIDAVTVQFILNQPNSFFISNFTTGILPKHILGTVPVGDILKNEFSTKPVGTGPYMMQEAIKELSDDRSEVTLTSFADYYGAKPSIGFFRIYSFPNVVSLINEKGALNGIAKVSGQDAKILKDDGRFELYNYTLPQYTAIFMNMEHPFLKARGVRLALIKSIDKNDMLSVLPDKELVDNPLLEVRKDDWVYKYSKEEAQGGLYESGFKYPNGDQSAVRANDAGEALSLNLLVRDYTDPRQKEETVKLVNYLINKWREIGVEVKPDFQPMDVYVEKLQNRDYDLVFAGQSLGYNFDVYAFWHSTQAQGGGLNLSNYKSFAVDALIQDVRDTFDDAQKQEKLGRLANTLRDDFPAFFLYRPIYYYASDKKVNGLYLQNISFTSDRFANISDWVLQ